MNPDLSAKVQVALDDAAAGETVLALSSALARELGCELAVVYVESAASVSAAALSVTQVLPHAAASWLPRSPTGAWPAAPASARPDVLVMARRAVAPAVLAMLPYPVLLVG